MTIQSWAVLVLIMAASAYLFWSAWRHWRGGTPRSCCGTGCGGSAKPDTQPQPGATTFVPLENLADLARRHGERRASQEGRGEA